MRRLLRSALAFGLAVLYVCPRSAAWTGAAASPERGSTVSYARGFSIEYRPGYKLLRVTSPWPGARRGFSYVLYRRGSPKPADVAADLFVETPVRKAVTFSTTYIPQIAEIGEAESIVGVDSAPFVNNGELRARIAAGRTVEIARNWAPNVELMISLAPDAVFTYGMGNDWDSFPKLAEAGLPVIIDGEWNEAEPLARAEWIKFIAAFYDKEESAASYFDKVAAEYHRLTSLAAGAPERPVVLTEGPYQGAWNVAGGRSYAARFIADAGGRYLWADDRDTGSLTLSVEAVFERARRADLWLNPSLGANSVADVLAMDRRFAALPVMLSGNIWNSNRRMNGLGGNDYFESAVINPDKVLADLIKIFHPGLLADRPFTYYKKLAK